MLPTAFYQATVYRKLNCTGDGGRGVDGMGGEGKGILTHLIAQGPRILKPFDMNLQPSHLPYFAAGLFILMINRTDIFEPTTQLS
jgi:hypothetical protein